MASQNLINHFVALREQAIWIQNCQNICLALFGSTPEVTDTLHEVAGQFFVDLSKIMTEYMVLCVGRITDSSTTLGKGNLTIQKVDELLDEESLTTDKIRNLSDELHNYRDYISRARNQVVAHSDANTALNGLSLGEHTEAAMHEFFRNLQSYCDEVGGVIGEGPLDFSTQAGKGDVVDLLQAIKNRK